MESCALTVVLACVAASASDGLHTGIHPEPKAMQAVADPEFRNRSLACRQETGRQPRENVAREGAALAKSDSLTKAPASYLCQPAFCIDDIVRGPTVPYQPQPGDIFLATDQAVWAICGHWLAGGAGVHHSGIVFRRSDGRMGLIEAGPFNSVQVEVMDPIEHMRAHVCAGDKVWIRRRAIPLTAEESAALTAFIEAQDGKPFATWRLLGQVTLLRSRGPVRTWFIGQPHGCRDNFFCSELVTESCVAAGLLDPTTTRPTATYPRDLFYDHSFNWYLNLHLKLAPCWDPPARWLECCVP